jgi:hypothetical protein
MISRYHSLGRCVPAVLAGLVVCLAPAALRAQTVMFRNECRWPVIVQTSTLVKGVVRRDPPCVLRYGECTPKLKLDAVKVVTIYDGKSERVLFRDSLKPNPKPLYYSIYFNPRMPGRVWVKKQPPP